MKKLFSIIAILSFGNLLSADDYKAFGVQYGDWDVDGLGASSIDFGYSVQTGSTRFTTGIARLDPDFGSGATVWSSGLDYAFGDWGAGTPFVGISYSDSNVDGVDGYIGYEIGYAKSSSTGTNYSFSFSSCNDDCETATNIGVSWDVGNGNNIGLSYTVEDDVDVLGLGYIKKW